MSDVTVLAKPYAKAIYSLAKEQSSQTNWFDVLNALSDVVKTDQVQQLLVMPGLEKEKLAGILVKLFAGKLDHLHANLLKILARNDRIGCIPEIANQYAELKANDENKTSVCVTTAVSVDGELQQKLTKEISDKLKSDSELEFTVDEDIIGGAVLRIGDKVIDISLQNALKRLQKQLNVGSSNC